MDDWINDVADWFDGAKYYPKARGPGEIEFKKGNSLTNALGGALSINIGELATSGRRAAEGSVKDRAKCVADPDSVCAQGKCPETPRIVFSCGEGTCTEARSTAECNRDVNACLKSLISAAIGAKNIHNEYKEDDVKAAMTDAYEKSHECESIVAMHLKCDDTVSAQNNTCADPTTQNQEEPPVEPTILDDDLFENLIEMSRENIDAVVLE